MKIIRRLVKELRKLRNDLPSPSPRNAFDRFMDKFSMLHWSARVICLGVLLFMMIFALWCGYALVTARGTGGAAVSVNDPTGGGQSRKLVVLVHGWTQDSGSMEGVAKAAQAGQNGADLLLIDFKSNLFSNADPARIASRIEEEIEKKDAAGNYDEISLCGYSAGALLLRKAYVYGHGNISDAPGADPKRLTKRAPRPWVNKVRRIVLLAGMNRGAQVETMAPNMGRFFFHGRRFALAVAKFTGTGRLGRGFLRGSPFVANLRMQWMQTCRKRDAEHEADPVNVPRLQVIQLLGTDDVMVGTDDSRDAEVCENFIWLKVNDTDHRNILEIKEPETAGQKGSDKKKKTQAETASEERWEKIRLAFGDDTVIKDLENQKPTTDYERDDKVRVVVFVLHGIRDMGQWTTQFTAPLKCAYKGRTLKDGFLLTDPETEVKVTTSRYGYFGMGPFLLGGDRQQHVRWFMDKVTELTARYPNMEEFHFIGHSNGTYVLGSAMDQYVTLSVDRVALAGSVLRRDYPWDSYGTRLGSVCNYVGHDDWVVGLCPKVFEMPGFSALNPDIGGAGYDGFEEGTLEDAFVKGGHGAALDKQNISSVVGFITNGTLTPTKALHHDGHPWWNIFSSLCWLLWILAVGLLLTAAVLLPRKAARHLTRWIPRWAPWRGTVVFYGTLGYACLVWYFLLTV